MPQGAIPLAAGRPWPVSKWIQNTPEHGTGAQSQEARTYRPAVHLKLRKALATAAVNRLKLCTGGS